MNDRVIALPKRQGFIKSSRLLILAFATAFFPRLLDTIGVPALVNFVHFAVVPVVCGLVVLDSKTRDKLQIVTTSEILVGLTLFLTVAFLSALYNGAGAINAVLDFLLLTEPFMLMVAIASIPLSQASISQFRNWFIGFNIFHLLLALFQRYALNLQTDPGQGDNIQGVFYRSGSGHVVGSSVSMTFAICYFLTAKRHPLWLRLLVLFACFIHLLAADAKQVILTFVAGVGILAITKAKDIKKLLIYGIGGILFTVFFVWAIQNYQFLRPFRTWMNFELYGPRGEGTLLKISGIQIILSHFQSPVNWLLGLGPGHTIDRLGGWMLKDYADLLDPLGATRTTVGDETWDAVFSSWLGPRSSVFSPFFGWAAIWGDIGFLGLAAYLYVWAIVWRRLCLDDLSKLAVLTVFVHGFIFTQLEEPGYMLFIASLVGLRWHERRTKAQAASQTPTQAQVLYNFSRSTTP